MSNRCKAITNKGTRCENSSGDNGLCGIHRTWQDGTADGVAALNAKQRQFVAEYLVDLNATQAAIRAGYSPKTANRQGHRLLTNADISAAVEKRAEERLRATNIQADRVLQELGRLCTSDVRDLFDEHGNLLPIHELPDELAAAVAGIEVVMRSKGRDEPPEYVHKVRLWDKNTALTNLAKHYGLLKDLVEHTGKDGGPIATTETSVPWEKLSLATRKKILAELDDSDAS